MSNARIVITVIAALGFASGLAAEDATVDTLDGQSFTGQVTALTPKALKIKTATDVQQVARKDVSEILFAPAADLLDPPGRMVVETVDGGRIGCSELALADGKLALTSTTLGEQSVALKSVRAILLPASNKRPREVLAECQRQRIEPGSRDVLAIERADGKWVSATGVLLSIGEKQIGFRYQGEDRVVDRAGVRVIFLAELAGERPKPTGALHLRDGSSVHVASATLDAESLKVESLPFGEMAVAIEHVASLRFFSDRLVRLTDLKPSAVTEYGTFDETFKHRVDRSVGGGALRLDGTVYRNGLGLHSVCELTYELNGQYQTFMATAGIDDAVRPGGLATLEILGDGETLEIKHGLTSSKAMTLSGKAAAAAIRVDVSDVKTLVIRVGFGADQIGVSDHVDLASPRLVK